VLRALRFFLRFLAALVPLAILYFATALGFALFPASGRAQQAGGEPVVYVCTTLAHADIIMPSQDPLVDWSAVFPAASPRDLPAHAYLAFGWGDLRFFRETPSWADVSFSTALGALAGFNDTALRVMAVNPPTDDPDCRPLVIDRAGRQAVIAHILKTLVPEASGRPQRRPGGAAFEAYYLANGRYGPLRTCNQWMAEALAAAGLPYARFAPFSFSITWPLD
jgi:uncharacterized protein (TIGR02117 family)